MPNKVFYKDLKKKFQVLAGLILWIGHLGALEAAETPSEELSEQRIFYRVSIGGAPAGRLETVESHTADLRTTAFDLELEFERAGLGQGLGMSSRFVETKDGVPVEAWSQQRLGSTPVETTYRFTAEGVEIESRQGESTFHRTLPKRSGWLPPAAAEDATTRAMAAALAGGPQVFKVTSMDPLLGAEPMTTTWELEAQGEELVLDGRRFRTSRWRQTQDLAPQVPSVVWLDAEGELRRTRTEMAGMDMLIEWTASEPKLGEAGAAAGGSPAGVARPEVMVQTFLRPDHPLAEARSLRRAVYELRGKDLNLPEVGYQRVEKTVQGLRLIVDMASPREENLSAEALAPYLRPSVYINHENAKVRELHQRALAEAPKGEGPAARAERLRRFVGRYLVSKDLRSVLATASEVAENASGDCTEHAVLLAALLRAEGIPSRVVFGLIYVDSFAGEREIFGYHMWTQAYLSGRFVDLDATLAQPFDAAHISLGTSALEEESSSLAVMNNSMQTLSKATLVVIEPALPRGDGDQP